MALPPRPPKRFAGRFAPPTKRASAPERLRHLVKKHEEEERPFEPERRGTWRGKAHELVVNPSDFYKDLRELVDSARLYEPDESFEKAKELLKEGGDPNDVMDALNTLLDFHGVGAFPSQKLPHSDFLYLEAGDTYNATLVYSYAENKYFVSTFGDIVENAEPEMEQEAWDSWLESEVRKLLAREIKEQSSLSESATEKIVAGLDDIESERLHGKFVEAVNEVGGEVAFENDGGVFVTRHKEAIEALASELIDAAGKVPEQGSFGLNPRRKSHSIEEDTPIIPLLVAESVTEELQRLFPKEDFSDHAAPLAAKAERLYSYGHNEQFRKKIRAAGNRGRDALYAFMRHWVSAELKAKRPDLFRRLPRDYARGIARGDEPVEFGVQRNPARHNAGPMTADEAIRASRAAGGTSVVLDRFTYEDEQALADAARDWRTFDDEPQDHTIYEGDDWRVELVGDGDPR